MFGLSTSLTLLLVFCLISALTFEFINGFHDTANAVATVIYTHSLKPLTAVVWSGIWNFIGVNVGGIAVAIGIVNMLPLEALTDSNIVHNIAIVMALISTAIIWNLGTWYLGIPCSSSHTLIGSITGVGIAYMMLPGSQHVMNWDKVESAGLSLLISPIIGFVLAILMMLLMRLFIKDKAIFKEPPAKKAPPMWIRSMVILTSTFVSFSHGSNDGQKGVGLVMIILIAIVPARFAIDLSKDPVKLKGEAQQMQLLMSQVDAHSLTAAENARFSEISLYIDSIANRLATITDFDQASKNAFINTRKDILILSKKSDIFLAELAGSPVKTINSKWVGQYESHLKKIRTFTEYSPWWVIFLISLSLGLGTMIGWKRIVVTLGEKIGKTKLNYAQGVTTNLITAGTISAASVFGLPVSTTHVLSSGIAGSMVSGNGLKNLQKKTIASIGIAWLITIPVTMLFSGMLFLLFRLLF